MDSESISRLILDALYYRRPTPGGSCFVSNVAGLELLEFGPSALEPIEFVLRTVAATRSNSDVRAEFLGLDYVLGAYAVIGSRHDAKRAAAFVQMMPVQLQAEFVAVLPIFFRRHDGQYRFGVPPASEFLDFVDESRSSEVELLRAAADRAVSFLAPQPTRLGSREAAT